MLRGLNRLLYIRKSIDYFNYRYERYAKQLVEKIDGQTEMINFHLEGALLDMKEYIRD